MARHAGKALLGSAAGWLLLRAGAFEYHPDHTTCEGHEIALHSPADLDNWPADKPLKCLWTAGRIRTPVVNGKTDRALPSCHITSFLMKLKQPEELRALKLYMEDLNANCFFQCIAKHKCFFPKLQILHLHGARKENNGDIWKAALKMAPVSHLREFAVTTEFLHAARFDELPILHHLDVFGIEAETVFPDGPSMLMLMLTKAPNVLNIHLGGALQHEGPSNMGAKRLFQHCPAHVCSGLTTLSINSAAAHVVYKSELADVLKAMPSLRKFMMGKQAALASLDMQHLARKLVHLNHPLPHVHFHVWDGCTWNLKQRHLCMDALHDFITSFPDLTDLTMNHNQPDIMIEAELREILDESITLHNSSWDLPALWGAHPPDLHPPIEEHLSDVHTEISAPDTADAHRILKQGSAKEPVKGGVSMNVQPRPGKKADSDRRRGVKLAPKPVEKDDVDRPWRREGMDPVQSMYHGDHLFDKEQAAIHRAAGHDHDDYGGEAIHENLGGKGHAFHFHDYDDEL